MVPARAGTAFALGRDERGGRGALAVRGGHERLGVAAELGRRLAAFSRLRVRDAAAESQRPGGRGQAEESEDGPHGSPATLALRAKNLPWFGPRSEFRTSERT